MLFIIKFHYPLVYSIKDSFIIFSITENCIKKRKKNFEINNATLNTMDFFNSKCRENYYSLYIIV